MRFSSSIRPDRFLLKFFEFLKEKRDQGSVPKVA